MQLQIILDSIKIVAVICLIAYPLTMHRSLITYPTFREKAFLALFFGALSVLGNILGIETFNGALLDSRIVGPVVGGIIAGPTVGLVSGLIGGIHRYSLGGFTIVPAFIANIIAGLIGGYAHIKFGKKRLDFVGAFLVGFVAELMLQILILLLAKPRIVAEVVVSMYGLTTIIVNAIGVALFVVFVKDIQASKHLIGANYAEKALDIANKSLPILKNGFNKSAATELAKIIYSAGGLDAVAITNKERTLAFRGVGRDHHIPGDSIITSATNKAIKQNEYTRVLIINSKEEIGCPHPNCPLDSVATAPLTCDGEFLGFLKIYKIGDTINPPEVKMITGLANLLSLQLRNVKLDEQAKLLANAEYAALRSQVNPHFLFNALSVIKILVRTNPSRAKELIVNLAAFFRRTLKRNDDTLPFSEELEGIRLYLSIQEARFGDRLQVNIDVENACLQVPFPTFALQPIVENSMNHALSLKKGLLSLEIVARISNEHLDITVQDNGLGIPEEVIAAVRNNLVHQGMGIGLTNINRRLKSLYGSNYSFELENQSYKTEVKLRIPLSGESLGVKVDDAYSSSR